MTGAEFHAIRERLRMTQAEIAAELGVQWGAVARWEGGTRKVSEPVARLLLRIAAERRTKKRPK